MSTDTTGDVLRGLLRNAHVRRDPRRTYADAYQAAKRRHLAAGRPPRTASTRPKPR